MHFSDQFSERGSAAKRAASIHMLLVVLLFALIMILAWVVNSGFVWVILAELERNAESSSLGATLVLVDDGHLRGYLYNQPDAMPALLDKAHDEAKKIASLNSVNGKPLVLLDNYTNDPNGDIVLGAKNTPFDPFVPAVNVDDPKNTSLISVNAVRVQARLLKARNTEIKLFFPNFTTFVEQEIQLQTTAMMDRDVVGFKHVVEAPIPLAPLAFLADFSKNDPDSWNHQVEDFKNAKGQDDFQYSPAMKKFVPGKDGLPEFRAKVTIPPAKAKSNTAFLFIGIADNDYSALNDQLINGITKTQLQSFGSFVLSPANNKLTVPGTEQAPPGLIGKTELINTLDFLADNGLVRIFPLYCEFSGGDPVLCGFVAGRVVRTVSMSKGNFMMFEVQPTMIAIHSAVTNTSQDGAGGIDITNSYISKVRIVEN